MIGVGGRRFILTLALVAGGVALWWWGSAWADRGRTSEYLSPWGPWSSDLNVPNRGLPAAPGLSGQEPSTSP